MIFFISAIKVLITMVPNTLSMLFMPRKSHGRPPSARQHPATILIMVCCRCPSYIILITIPHLPGNIQRQWSWCIVDALETRLSWPSSFYMATSSDSSDHGMSLTPFVHNSHNHPPSTRQYPAALVLVHRRRSSNVIVMAILLLHSNV